MRVAWPALFIVVVSMAAALFVSAPAPLGGDSDRERDLRAVYGRVVSHAVMGGDPVLVTTMPNQREIDDRCFEIPAGSAADWNEACADFERTTRTARPLPEPLLTTRKYVVLDEKGFRDLEPFAELSESPLVRRRFPKSTHVMMLSGVGFNGSRTLAVLRVGYWCGGMCAKSFWITLQKVDGAWQPRPWSHCVAVA